MAKAMSNLRLDIADKTAATKALAAVAHAPGEHAGVQPLDARHAVLVEVVVQQLAWRERSQAQVQQSPGPLTVPPPPRRLCAADAAHKLHEDLVTQSLGRSRSGPSYGLCVCARPRHCHGAQPEREQSLSRAACAGLLTNEARCKPRHLARRCRPAGVGYATASAASRK